MISILIPFRNAGPYLKDCLDSILKQTEQNWEVIAINDNSTDNGFDIVQSYCQTDSRFRCVPAQGKGIIAALNQAYALSSGTLITRMDADDVMEPFKLFELKKILNESNEPTVATGLVRYFSDQTLGEGYQRYENWINNSLLSKQPYNEIYKECVVPSPCWMIRREDFDKIGAFDSPVYPEDYDLCFRFYQAGYQIKSSPQVLHHWRDYPIRTSRTDPRLADQSFMRLKLDYFQKLELKSHHKLTLWGAGNKGKKLARVMLQNKLSFRWVCNNPNKVGKKIYGIPIESPKIVTEPQQKTIVAISQNGAKMQIEDYFKKNNLNINQDYYYFL